MIILDLLGFFKKHTLPLLRSYDAGDGYHVFEFGIDGMGMAWRAGQHGFFTLPGRGVTGQTWRAFSVASVPSEQKITLATRIPPTPSSFKTHLLALQPGDMITMRGPYGWVYFKDTTTPTVLIAGGVGITPFRAMLYDALRTPTRPVHLIYSAKDSYLFKAEIDTVVEQYSHIHVTYTTDIPDTTAAITAAIAQYGTQAYYCISGAPGMIAALKKQLQQQSIPTSRILTDSFRGY